MFDDPQASWWQCLPPDLLASRAVRPIKLEALPMPRHPRERKRLPRPTQLRRLVVNYDDCEHCGAEARPAIAYGVELPDSRIILWHAHNGYIDIHRSLYALHAGYAEHGNCHVEFLDSRVP